MYARGAMPDTFTVPEPLFALVPLSPAAIPATCVPCSDSFGSKGSLAYRQFAPGGGKARATITFAVVYAALPFGKPAGIVKPAGEKNGCVWSTPSSMIPILIPWPAVARVEPQTCGAPITCGLWYSVRW